MKILIASPIDPETLRALENLYDVVCAFDRPPDELKVHIQGCQVLIFRSGVKITREVLQSAQELGLVIRAGSGVDNIDMDYVLHSKLALVRIPEPGARAVAEMSFGLMLAMSRNILQADAAMRKGHWVKHEIESYLLSGKTLGIIGAGNIGSQVGQMGSAWGMEVIGCVERPSSERVDELAAKKITLKSFTDVIQESDYISIHVPLKDSTHHMINAEELKRMKQGVYLVNLARGGVVDEDALLQALTSKQVRGAALDVHAREGNGQISPLAGLPNVILTPHIGATTIDTQREIGLRILDSLRQYAERRAQADLVR